MALFIIFHFFNQKMTEILVKDAGGDTLRSVDVGNNYQMPAFFAAEDVKTRFDNIVNTVCRDDDIMLLSYPKTGYSLCKFTYTWSDNCISFICFLSLNIM